MEDLLVQMGKRMRKRRKQLRLTQEELAEGKQGLLPRLYRPLNLERRR